MKASAMWHHRSRKLFLPALAAATIGFVGGCGYPKVSSRTYEIAKALYAVCNREQSDKLESVVALINDSLHDGSISTAESRWLRAVIEQARAGEWESATRETRQILEDQIEW